jgi:hypothetical protein
MGTEPASKDYTPQPKLDNPELVHPEYENRI